MPKLIRKEGRYINKLVVAYTRVLKNVNKSVSKIRPRCHYTFNLGKREYNLHEKVK